MKIDPTVKTAAPTAVAEERTRTAKQAGRAARKAKPRASVKLSSLSSQLQEIEAGMDTSKAVDSEARRRNQALRSTKARFEVERRDVVADRLLESTRDFLRSAQAVSKDP